MDKFFSRECIVCGHAKCRVWSADAVLTQFPKRKAVVFLESQESVGYQYVLKAVMLLYLHTIYVGLDFCNP
jgi:hypothetical protein